MGGIKKFVWKAGNATSRKGISYIIRAGNKRLIDWALEPFSYLYYKTFRSAKTFMFNGKSYKYFYHRYNTTWRNERAVEVPIVWEVVENYHGRRILEIGNVLSHYFDINHEVLDKYEKGDGVVNEDVVDFQPSRKYDLIVSVSTLEHVGWDENPREPMKIQRAIEHLMECLASPGKMMVTLPLGHNFAMEELLHTGKLHFSRVYCMKRLPISTDNRWCETDLNQMTGVQYNHPFNNANGLVVGVIEKD